MITIQDYDLNEKINPFAEPYIRLTSISPIGFEIINEPGYACPQTPLTQ
jgi:hypothetical protein